MVEPGLTDAMSPSRVTCAVGTVVADKRKEKEARSRANERSRHAHYAPREQSRANRPVGERPQG